VCKAGLQPVDGKNSAQPSYTPVAFHSPQNSTMYGVMRDRKRRERERRREHGAPEKSHVFRFAVCTESHATIRASLRSGDALTRRSGPCVAARCKTLVAFCRLQSALAPACLSRNRKPGEPIHNHIGPGGHTGEFRPDIWPLTFVNEASKRAALGRTSWGRKTPYRTVD
jgi:hypothetical protein